MIEQVLTIWCLISLPILNPACTSGSSWFMYCWSLTWRILSITLLACEMSAIVWQSEHSLSLSFFGIGMKTDIFQSCGHCLVFHSCWRIECSTCFISLNNYLCKIRHIRLGQVSPNLRWRSHKYNVEMGKVCGVLYNPLSYDLAVFEKFLRPC